MMRDSQAQVERVLVPLGMDIDEAVLTAAVELAAALRAELAGWFIEDLNVLRMAELPFSREFGLASGRARPIDTSEVERALRSAAARARGALARAAQQSGVQWSFEIARGRGFAPLLAAQRDVDWLVLEKARLPANHFVFVSRAKRERRLPGEAHLRPVAVVFDGSAHATRALHAAHKLARELSTSLLVLLHATASKSTAILRMAARDVMESAGVRNHNDVRYIALHDATIRALANVAREHQAAVLVWSDSALRGDEETLARALDALPCPLIVTD